MNRMELEKLVREQIPLAKAMEVQVTHVDGREVELSAPLAPNHNHLGTAFGGSLTSLMVLAAYCRLFDLMGRRGHVVLKSCHTEFLRPVTEDLRALCPSPPVAEKERFQAELRATGRARMVLVSEIRQAGGKVAARAVGEFIAKNK